MIVLLIILSIYVISAWIAYFAHKEFSEENEHPWMYHLGLIIVFIPIINTIGAICYIRDIINDKIEDIKLKRKLKKVFSKIKNKEAREELMNLLKNK